MSQMSGSYSTELLKSQASRPDQSWFSRFGPRLKQAILDLPTDPAAIASYVVDSGAIEPEDRRGDVSDAARTPAKDPFEPKISADEAKYRQLAGRLITGQIDMGRADLSGATDPYTALADKLLIKQSQQTLNDPMAPPEAVLNAQMYAADHSARKQAARLGGEAAIAEASASPAELPARYVQLWSQGYTDDEIRSLMTDTWANLDGENAQKMMDRLEIEADVLQDQGKLLEAQGVLRARRSLMAKSPINLDANARPYDVLLEQMIQHDVKRGGRAGAFQAAGSDAFLATVRGIGRLLDVVPDGERDYLERLTAASYNEHPATSFAGSFAGGMADPVFFGLSMAIAKAPVSAASRARYAQDMIKTGVPSSVAQQAAGKLTTEELAVHRLSRYFLNNEKALRAAGVVRRGAPLGENTAKALAQITWNAADGMVSNALAEGIVSWSDNDSPATIAIRMAQGGLMGLGLGTALGGLFSGAAAISRAISTKLPPETRRALNIASGYVASGAEDAPEIRQVVEQSAAALKQAASVKGEPLTDVEARALLAEMGVDIDALRGLGRERLVGPREDRRRVPEFKEIDPEAGAEANAVSDAVVDAQEMQGAFDKTPETVEETIAQVVPDADASMAASLAEEATAHRSALAELVETRRQLAEANAEARTDPLTKLSNRRGMEEEAGRMFMQADEAGKPVSVVMFDMSNFKALNDVFGHERGDEALDLIAKVLDREIRGKPDPEQGRTAQDLDLAGVAARPGGDEFVAMLYGADEESVWNAINRIEQAVEYELEQAGLGHIDTTKGRRRVRLIGGVAVRAPGAETGLDQLLNAADQASIARKEKWKRTMREPEGRFDLSEVRGAARPQEPAPLPTQEQLDAEFGESDVSGDADPDTLDDGPSPRDGGDSDDLPAEGFEAGDDPAINEAGGDRSPSLRDLVDKNRKPQGSGAEGVSRQQAIFPELQETIDDLESRERDLIGLKERFPEIRNVPDEELEQAFTTNFDLAVEFVDTYTNAPTKPKKTKDPAEYSERLRSYLEALEETIQALDWPVKEPEMAFREADPDLWIPGDLEGTAYNDLEREMFVRTGEDVGRLAQAMQDQLTKEADRVDALLGDVDAQDRQILVDKLGGDPLGILTDDTAQNRANLAAQIERVSDFSPEESGAMAQVIMNTVGDNEKLAEWFSRFDQEGLDSKAHADELVKIIGPGAGVGSGGVGADWHNNKMTVRTGGYGEDASSTTLTKAKLYRLFAKMWADPENAPNRADATEEFERGVGMTLDDAIRRQDKLTTANSGRAIAVFEGEGGYYVVGTPGKIARKYGADHRFVSDSKVAFIPKDNLEDVVKGMVDEKWRVALVSKKIEQSLEGSGEAAAPSGPKVDTDHARGRIQRLVFQIKKTQGQPNSVDRVAGFYSELEMHARNLHDQGDLREKEIKLLRQVYDEAGLARAVPALAKGKAQVQPKTVDEAKKQGDTFVGELLTDEGTDHIWKRKDGTYVVRTLADNMGTFATHEPVADPKAFELVKNLRLSASQTVKQFRRKLPEGWSTGGGTLATNRETGALVDRAADGKWFAIPADFPDSPTIEGLPSRQAAFEALGEVSGAKATPFRDAPEYDPPHGNEQIRAQTKKVENLEKKLKKMTSGSKAGWIPPPVRAETATFLHTQREILDAMKQENREYHDQYQVEYERWEKDNPPKEAPDGQQARQASEAEASGRGDGPATQAEAASQSSTERVEGPSGERQIVISATSLPPEIRPNSQRQAELIDKQLAHAFGSSAVDAYRGLDIDANAAGTDDIAPYQVDRFKRWKSIAAGVESFERNTQDLDPDVEADARAILTARDDVERFLEDEGVTDEKWSTWTWKDVALEEPEAKKLNKAEYGFDGERLDPNIEDLDPKNLKSDAAKVRAAFKRYMTKRGAKEGELKNPEVQADLAMQELAPVAREKLAEARHAEALEKMVSVPTYMDDMKVWAFDDASAKRLIPQLEKARKEWEQVQAGKTPASMKTPKPSKPKGGIGKTGSAKTHEDIQRRMLAGTDTADRRVRVTDTSIELYNRNAAIRVRRGSFDGKPPEVGEYWAEGKGIKKMRPEEIKEDRILKVGATAFEFANVKHNLGAFDVESLETLKRGVKKAGIVSEYVGLSQNPDGTIGMATVGEGAAFEMNVQDGASPMSAFKTDQMLKAIEIALAAGSDSKRYEIQIGRVSDAASAPYYMRLIELGPNRDVANHIVFGGVETKYAMPDAETAAPTPPKPISPNQIGGPTQPDRIRRLRANIEPTARPISAETAAPSGVSAIDPSGGTSPSPSKIPQEITQPVANKKAVKLAEQIKADPTGKKIGIRSIREWLSDEMGILELMRREQTGKRHPAHYMQDPHLIRSRNPSAAWLFHEHGHALSAIIREDNKAFLNPSKPASPKNKRPEFVNPVADAAMELALAEGSMASAMSPEEGFAEWARLYITQPDRLRLLDRSNTITNAVRKARPDMMELMDDAARLFRAHMDRSIEARWRAHQNDVSRTPPSARGLLRGSMVRYGSRGLAGKFAVDDVLRIINKDADTISEGWRKVAQVERAYKGTGGDVELAYNGLLHIDQLTGIALQGMKEDGSGGGLRVHAIHEIDGGIPKEHAGKARLGGLLDHEGNIGALREAGFKIDDALKAQLQGAKHGDMITFNNRSVQEIIRPLGSRFDEFETYAQMKATVARKMVRKGFDFQTQSEGTTFMDLIQSIAKAEYENPEFKTVFEDLQDVMDKTLLIDVMSGESTVENAITLRNTFEHYLPLTRVGERGSKRVNIGPTTSPTSGIRRSRGSENAAEPILAAIHRKIAQSINAYYWNAYMTSPIRFAKKLEGLQGVPTEAKRAANRVMLPLSLDTKKMVDLSEDEQRKMIAEWMRKKAQEWLFNEQDPDFRPDMTDEELADARIFDTTDPEEKARADAARAKLQSQRVEKGWDFSMPPEVAAEMRPADVNLVIPGEIPIFRRVAPNAMNVVAPMLGGRRRFYQINDPLLFEVFASTDRTGDIVRFADRLVGQMTQPWKNSITQTAVFALRSLARDYPTAMAMGVKMDDYKALIPGYYHAIGALSMITGKTPETLSAPEILSRTFRHVHSEDFIEQQSKLRRELFGELIPRGWKDMSLAGRGLSAPGIAIRVLLRPIEVFNALSGQRALATLAETAPRVGAFVAAKARGLSDAEAQYAADTITGYFAERPLSNNAHQIYRMAGFTNPATQIASQYTQILLDPVPARAAAKIGILSGSVAVASGVIWAIKELVQTDEDRKREAERTEQERLTHMDIRGLRIPYDYGLAGGIQSFIFNSLDIHAGGLPPVDRKKLATKILSESLPPQVLAPWELLPPIARAGLETTTNFSMYRGRSLMPDYMTYLEPSEQTFSTTPEVYRWFGAVTNQSPVKIEHLVRNGISVKLADMVRAVDRAESGLVLEEMANLPEIGRMFTREPVGWNSRSVESVQELDRKYQNIRKRIEGMEGDPTVDPAVLRELRADMRQYRHFHEAMLKIERTYKQSKDADNEGRQRLQIRMVEIAHKAIESALKDEDE